MGRRVYGKVNEAKRGEGEREIEASSATPLAERQTPTLSPLNSP